MADHAIRSPQITVPANGTINFVTDFSVTHGSAFVRIPHVLESIEGSTTVSVAHKTYEAEPNKVTWTLRNPMGSAQSVYLCARVTDAYLQG